MPTGSLYVPGISRNVTPKHWYQGQLVNHSVFPSFIIAKEILKYVMWFMGVKIWVSILTAEIIKNVTFSFVSTN